jgi:hypothetical protein
MKNLVFEYDDEIIDINTVESLEGTITITFSESVENHVGMQKIGEKLESGISVDTLEIAKKKFEKMGYECELIDLIQESGIIELSSRVGPAKVLIIRNGVQALGGNEDNMFKELVEQDWDKKALMRGKVVNKIARWNICISKESQEPNYEEGKGRIVPFKELPETQNIKNNLHQFFGDKTKKLNAEGNYYYNTNNCYIGFHGDAERVIVIAVRLGVSIPLYYQWFLDSESKGKRITIPELNHGDVYVMSHKATGNDWKKRKIYTVRHAAGFNVPEPKNEENGK